MAFELPTEMHEPETYAPKLMLLSGLVKSGKSTFCASIPDTLIIDLEDGYRSLKCMRVRAENASDLAQIAKAIKDKTIADGKQPYRRIVIDNSTRLDEMSKPVAVNLYRKTPAGKMFGYKIDPATKQPMKDRNGNLIDDPNADVASLGINGYLYKREALKTMVNAFIGLSESLILVTHIKDKLINKDGAELSVNDIDLGGKMSTILAGMSDAVGIVYREKNKTFVDFNGGDNLIWGARPKYLRNKRFCVIESDESGDIKINTNEIFPE